MSVIVSRALPDVRDGLKPVHRRILFAMKENGYDSTKPYKKSARIVGDVMGNYYPHGDAAIYDAMVRMARFLIAPPLIDGQVILVLWMEIRQRPCAIPKRGWARLRKLCWKI